MTARAVLLLLLSAVACRAAEPADWVLLHGRVWTVDDARPWAEAVAVRGGEIVYVGDDAGARAHVGPGSRVIDLHGRLLLPGFVESHIHLALGGTVASGLGLEIPDSKETVLAKLRAHAAAHPEKKALFGANYYALLFDGDGPHRSALDAIVPDRPVLLVDHTLHSVWCNSRALTVAGITRDTPDPPGGEYVRDAAGEPTGFIKGSPAFLPVVRAIGAVSIDAVRATLPTILEGLSEFGFTAAMDMGNPLATEACLEALVDLDGRGELPLRLSMTHYVNTPELAATAVRTQVAYAAKYRSPNVRFDTLKIIGDSVIENRKAAVLEPYASTGGLGSLYFDADALREMVVAAAAAGHGTVVHSLGDRAVRVMLDMAERVRGGEGRRQPLILTHGQLIDPADRGRFAAHDVIWQTTGNWANLQPHYVEILGARRNDTLQFPFRTIQDSGATITFGSDWPATLGGFRYGVNPFINIYTAMHRRVPADLVEEFGSAPRVLEPAGEVLSLPEAIRAYTINGARQLGREEEIGSIVAGKKADLILLDRDLFSIDPEEIPGTKVLATMFDGRLVHDMAWGIGDADPADLEAIDDCPVGPCSHRCHAGPSRAVLPDERVPDDQSTLVPIVNEGGKELRFDWPMLRIGTAEYREGPTGVTVFRFGRKVFGAVDVRGEPVTSNTEFIRLARDTPTLDAVVFSGGSTYGIECPPAVASALKDDHLRTGIIGDVAHTTGAIIYDLGDRRLNEIYPDKKLAQAAFRGATESVFRTGSAGAGRFAKTGYFFGLNAHSGQGGAYWEKGDLKIACFTIVNALGLVADRHGRIVAGYRDPAWPADVDAPGLLQAVLEQAGDGPAKTEPTQNTTISLVVVNQKLPIGDLERLAKQVHTSMSRGLQPYATQWDGDVLFAVSTGEVELPADEAERTKRVALIPAIASEVMWDAILSSVPEQPVRPEPIATTAPMPQEHVGRFRFSRFVTVEITSENGTLFARATGERPAYAIGRDERVELAPVNERLDRFTPARPGRYPLVLDFSTGTLVINPGPWAQGSRRLGTDE